MLGLRDLLVWIRIFVEVDVFERPRFEKGSLSCPKAKATSLSVYAGENVYESLQWCRYSEQ